MFLVQSNGRRCPSAVICLRLRPRDVMVPYIRLIKNNAELCRSYGQNDYNSPSCSAVLELNVNDQVYVATESDVRSVYCAFCAGFSGFLIKEY